MVEGGRFGELLGEPMQTKIRLRIGYLWDTGIKMQTNLSNSTHAQRRLVKFLKDIFKRSLKYILDDLPGM